MLCRVYHKPDGSVVIIKPNYRYKLATETDAEFVERICTKDAPNSGLMDLPSIDVDDSQLPARKDRAKFKIKDDKVIVEVDVL